MTRIEDYALIGDTHSAGLVGLDGSIDWLCLPRFDSGSTFGALLDPLKGGHWQLVPRDPWESHRRYRGDTLVLETTFETASGSAAVVDCLPLEQHSDPSRPREIYPYEVVVRIVSGKTGTLRWDMVFEPRFDYGYVEPWLRHVQADGESAVEAVGGPDALVLRAGVPLTIEDCSVHASFEVSSGEAVAFLAAYHPSHVRPNTPLRSSDGSLLVELTTEYWQRWAARCSYEGRWRQAVVRSLLTLKALTFSPTGGIVAAATTSLPEALGGERNWDYRYCWLRDATYMLDVLVEEGYTAEAVEWRDWLLRAVAGDPQDMQIMYGVRGERRLLEYELPWLSGYEDSRPVRIGNGAVEQFQLDVYGEVMDSFHSARLAGIESTDESWKLERNIVDFVCRHWRDPDEGIWEVRSGRRHFVHSKVMAWVALDRAVVAVEDDGLEGPLDRWKQVRDEIRADVLQRGYNEARACFTRSYGSQELDASLLMLPIIGFLPAGDDRMQRTIEAIERELVVDGFVLRYRTEAASDGLPAGEGTFLMCTFWLAKCLKLLGRDDDAGAMFERVVNLRNDVGLLSEQYDARRRRLVGNFPQAFSHTALITTALAFESSMTSDYMRRSR
ncbi:MAG: glycoside hydrolase family 15 protein [Actinomycetota bacterium]